MPLFELHINTNECETCYLDQDGRFKELPSKLISPVANCIFSTTGTQIKSILISADTLTRFSFLIAIYQDGVWRLRFRAVLSERHGLLMFKMTSTLHRENDKFVIPSNFQYNTVGIIGIKPTNIALTIDVQVFANQSGKATEQFNFAGNVTWNAANGKEETTISALLDGNATKALEIMKFNSELFSLKDNSLSNFQVQRLG